MTIGGLILHGKHSLPDVCNPLSDELGRCFCVVDIQSGLFNSAHSCDSKSLAERLLWEVPAFARTSTAGFRPGALPLLADYLMVDEWSYFYAIDATEAESSYKASVLANHIGDLSEPFLLQLGQVADLLICHADGWWEFTRAE